MPSCNIFKETRCYQEIHNAERRLYFSLVEFHPTLEPPLLLTFFPFLRSVPHSETSSLRPFDYHSLEGVFRFQTRGLVQLPFRI